jgi:hypothetical protein
LVISAKRRILKLLRRGRGPTADFEPLTTERIDAGYQLYWTKMALDWDDERRAAMAARVAEVIGSPGFENNALERRFRVPGLDDLAHSGASLLALANTLTALDNFESQDENEGTLS